MTEAISNAAVVCCFMSPDYEDSDNRKLELEHAKKLCKRIIPCMVIDRKVWKPSPSKWLRLITSSLIALDFSDPSEENIRKKTEELIRQIKIQAELSPKEPSTKGNKLFEAIRQKYLK